MNKETTEKFKKLLEKEKKETEDRLASFAKKDKNLEGDYDTKFPDLGTGPATDELAQEVSLYEERLPIEYTLETKLQEINSALEKIEKGTYGICENGDHEINIQRLETKPEAKYCIECKAKIDKSKIH